VHDLTAFIADVRERRTLVRYSKDYWADLHKMCVLFGCSPSTLVFLPPADGRRSTRAIGIKANRDFYFSRQHPDDSPYSTAFLEVLRAFEDWSQSKKAATGDT